MDTRTEFAYEYQRLQNWQPGDPVSLTRRAKLLQAGYLIGTGGAALLSAQTHIVPFLQSLTGPVLTGSQGANGLMLLWTRAAQVVMNQQTGLGSLAALDAVLSFGPALVLALGVVLLFYASHKTKPRVADTSEETDE